MGDDPRLDELIRQVGNAGRKYQQAEAIADMLGQKQASAIWLAAKHDMEFMLRDLKEYEHELDKNRKRCDMTKANVTETVVDGLPYVICRTFSAGVFAGFLQHREGKEAVLLNARRIWHWAGAATLSELSQHGTKRPDECRFPCEVPEVTLTEVIEVLPVSAKAKASIDGVPVWRA